MITDRSQTNIRCGFVALASADLEAHSQFFERLLKQTPTAIIPDVYAEFQLPGLKLGIFQPNTNHQSEFGIGGGAFSLCLEVKDLEMAIADITALGCPPPGKIMVASHGREIYAFDPWGNRIIFHEAVT